MPLSWNEIKSRAMAFSRRWQDAADEKQQSIPFWIDFFDIFGLTNRRVASFEHAVKKHGGGQGYVDLFWPGQMLVEQKSAGKPLEPAFDQAMGYFPGLPERDLPHTLVVCDFQRFRVIDLDSRREIAFALADLHKHVRWTSTSPASRSSPARASCTATPSRWTGTRCCRPRSAATCWAIRRSWGISGAAHSRWTTWPESGARKGGSAASTT